MKQIFLALSLIPLAASAETLPPGLLGARLLPGWTDAEGNRIAALELRLEPGWKTYWRSPGDSGIPPSFDWQGSENIGEVRFHWPAPEVIDSGGVRSFGFHDGLILPFEVVPAVADQPVGLTATIDLGVCDNICVPVHLSLTAGAAGDQPDPVIEAALAAQPATGDRRPACLIAEIKDGLRLDLTVTDEDWIRAIAVELPEQPEIWVEVPDLTHGDGGLSGSAEMVPPDGKPFDLDAGAVLFTLIGDRQAVQMRGCDVTG